MGVEVLRKTVGIFSGRGLFKRKIKDFLILVGGLPVEQINRKSFEVSKEKNQNSFIKNFIKDIRESSKIFYNKYLRTTVYYDHLEKNKIENGTLESVMMDFIRRQ